MKKITNIILITIIILFTICYNINLQSKEIISSTTITQIVEKPAADKTTESDKKDIIDNDRILYKVMLVSLIIWIALSVYIFSLNRKIKKLENKLDEK